MKRNTLRDGSARQAGRHETKDSKRIRILVADDNDFMRHCIQLLLARDGFEVVDSVVDGEALVSSADRHAHDLVITDIHMPRMNGLQATREILSRHAGTPVILLTSDDDYETARMGFEIGAMGYVVKDDIATDLEAAIEAVLTGKAFLSGCVVRHTYGTGNIFREKSPVGIRFHAL
jgi:two-component system, NarL family, response regulator NreC